MSTVELGPKGRIEATFLGTGTSVGVPMIGCRCDVCVSDDPRDKRTRSSLYLRAPGVSLVIDTGPDFRSQCLREGLSELDAILLTHSHTDHIMGFDDVRRFTVGIDASIDVYGRPSTLDDLKRIFAFAFDGTNRYPGYLKPVVHPVSGVFHLGGLEVVPLPVRHGKVETIGYLFRQGDQPKLAYLPDCKEAAPESVQLMRGVDVLVVDALRFTPHVTHMNFDEATALAAEVRPGQTIFTHLADEVLHARAEADLPDGISLAYDGRKFVC